MSPDSDSPPGLSLPPLSAQPAAWTSGTVTASSSVATVATSKERVDELLSAASTLIPSQPARVNKSDSSVEGELRGTEVIQRPATPATPYVPKRKTVPNPFVRGGVLTDFVGSAPPGKAVPQDMSTAQSSGASVSPKKEPIPISIGTVPPVPVQPVPPSPKQVTERSATSPTPSIPAPSSSHSPPRKWRELSPPSSPASSSKVKVEDVPSLSSVTQPSPGVLLAQFVNRLGPVPTAPRMSRFGGPLRQQSPYPPSPDTRKAQPAGTPTEPQEFPPDYRSLAFVGEGSYSNPLNIKPAAGNKWKANGPLPPQLSTAAPLKTNGSKKPVHIGSGWPHTRANGGGGRVRRQNGMVGPQGQGILGMVGPPNGGALDRGWGTNGPGDGISNEAPRGRGPRRSRARGRYPSPEPRDMYEPTTPVPGSPISSSNPSDSPKSTKSSQDAGFLPPAAPAHNTPTPAWPSDRGVKRAASPTPETPEARRAKAFQWPTSNGLHSVKLKGDDDVGVRSITYCSDGGLFAVICNDKSVRIWSNKSRTEIAKLAHNMHITSVAWMDRDSGVVTLGENGIVSTWTRSAANKWQWAKILNAGGKGEDMPCCLAYHRDHMAIGYPRSGVKVWLFIKGTWTPQRSIVRQNVTAIRFIGEGEALIGGTADGVLWHCQVPNGTLRASAFLRSKLFALDVDPRGTHALAAQAGSCILVNITHEGQGQVEQAYSPEESEVQAGAAYDFGALFAARGASLLFGSTQGCVLVWDRASGAIIHGLCHGEDHSIQAVASFDGSQVSDGHILTGTRQGQLTWFSQPPVDGSENRKGSW
ncbi:uncharacterized protein PHACADRAFT_257049 [Phanerochaete carnosa HHB-10118-sp]|uniref:Uncharacterized protein n=1 Tax=Phanerochaete carnosa (strain HHB-10118-sp) TaxID=650164 RepID=K5W9Z3_PHACS|nr:uncharacterized protein PHACADRAFT_257049 [Phanerochaete carnosa HHB-10118-sp]EKM56030.1 hypothetical protein PHACADRAFT_257049 [Phanerochaete carnosa HHB-10118-sp]